MSGGTHTQRGSKKREKKQMVTFILGEETKKNNIRQQLSTVMVIQCHCFGRRKNMINSSIMITQKSTSNVVIDPNKW